METEYFTIVKDTFDRISFLELVSPSYLRHTWQKALKLEWIL